MPKTINGEQLDPQAYRLFKAIREKESGGNYNAVGDNATSTGAFQFQDATWKGYAKDVLGDENAPMNKANQNQVAYKKIKSWKDSGWTPAQIAAAWNAGEQKALDGTWKTNIGYNQKIGVSYNTPQYVGDVLSKAKALKSLEEPTVEQSTTQQQTTAQETPVVPDKGVGLFSMGTLKGETSYKADMGGAEAIIPNLARTAGNLPSSAAKLTREVIAPFNPLDIDAPLNIGSNISKGVSALGSIFSSNRAVNKANRAGKEAEAELRRRGLAVPQDSKVRSSAIGNTLSGTGSTLAKGADIYKGVGEAIYNNLQQNVMGENSVSKGVGVSLGQGASEVARVGIEDPLLIPSIIYAPSKVRGTGVTTDTISATARPVIDTTKKVAIKGKDITSKAFEPTTAKLESVVVDNFQKGVKPRINMNMTPTQATKFEGDIVQAAQVIDRNKGNLKFVDDIGEETIGRNPKTLAELSDALEQTKKQVFKDYDSLAKQAGQQGLKIKTNPIAKELDTVINNEALQITNPQAGKYAQELQERLLYRELDAEIVQDVIQNYNESLKAFYRNPTYESASKASIDAMVANQFRLQLDEGITGLTGQQYQTIKNQYASLKAVEKDIIKAALRDARKNNKGLLDYTDILTGGDIVIGLITFNPAQLARGGVTRGIKEFYKYLNSPNRAVNKMFQSAEKLNQRSIPKSQATALPSPSVIPSGTTRLSTQPSANIPTTPNTNVITQQSNTLPQKSTGLINTKEKGITEIKASIDRALKKNGSGLNKIADEGDFFRVTFKNGENPLMISKKFIEKNYGDIKLADITTKSKLQQFSDKIKNTPNKQGGFIKLPQGKGDNLGQKINRYKSAEELGMNVTDSGHILDTLPKNKQIETLKIDSGLLRNKIGLDTRDLSKQTTGKLTSDYWLKKIEKGERPPILVGMEDGKLKVLDGNHRATAYSELGVKDVPVIFTNEAKSQLPKILSENKSTPQLPKPKVNESVSLPKNTKETFMGKVEEGYKPAPITTKLLKKLEGKTTVSKQFISDLTNSPDLKQVEKDLIRAKLEGKGDRINVAEFGKEVEAELLPLKAKNSAVFEDSTLNGKYYPKTVEEGSFNAKYESIALPNELRGKVKNYKENIYESPIKTSAGSTHFDNVSDKYFGHTRIEDMADNKTRRVIEVQSDLFQKGNLERETADAEQLLTLAKGSNLPEAKLDVENATKIINEKKPLQQYNNPTAHFRMVREEIQKASKDGKTKLQFPTGETAMKIEGLGTNNNWRIVRNGNPTGLNPNDLKVGQEIFDSNVGQADWIITDVLGDGKFKAVPKDRFQQLEDLRTGKIQFSKGTQPSDAYVQRQIEAQLQSAKEEFDISGKVDTNNPIYKFYDKELQKYLKNNFNAKQVTDAQGVSWFEVPVTKEYKNIPIEAFGIIGALGGASLMSNE